MIMNRLGNTNMQLSAIGLGTWAMGGGAYRWGWGSSDDKESIAAIRTALDGGINWIDTAPAYGLGRAEKIVGKALKRIRRQVVIVTKCGFRWDKKKRFYYRLYKDSIRTEVEQSLKRLKTDVIDIYKIHNPIPESDIPEAWNALTDLIKEGKIRWAGVSNFSLRQLKELEGLPPAVLQCEYNMLNPAVENKLLDYCRTRGIGFFAYSPMNKGLLTGNFTRERIKNLPPDDHRHLLPHFQEPYLTANLQLVEKLHAIARRNHKSLAQLAVAWVLRRPGVTAAIVGARKPSQIRETLQAGEWVLSEEDQADIKKILEHHQNLLEELSPQAPGYTNKRLATQMGSDFSPEFESQYALDIDGMVKDEQLVFNFSFHRDEFKKAVVEKLARDFKTNLLRIINHCMDKREAHLADEMSALDYQIKQDYDAYLERVQQEKLPDLTLKNDYKKILLTGSTGYLGAHLAAELLKQTDVHLYLLVRGSSLAESRQRLMKKMIFYFGKNFYQANKHRFETVCGDLIKDQLGIDAPQYENLCETVDAVLHLAANVKHFGLYKDLFRNNVSGTRQALEFAITGKRKSFHHVSTINVGDGVIPGEDHCVFTEYCHDMGQQPRQIYVKSKLEAEKQVLAYRAKGLQTSIYRFGHLLFHSRTGQFKENIEEDYFYAIIKTLIKTGLLPIELGKMAFVTSFVDYAAGAMALLFNRTHLVNETFHLWNPSKLSLKHMAAMLRELGIDLKDVPVQDLNDYLSDYDYNDDYEKMIQRTRTHFQTLGELETQTVPKCDRTIRILENLDFQLPEIKSHHIGKMVGYCQQVGFFR